MLKNIVKANIVLSRGVSHSGVAAIMYWGFITYYSSTM